MFKLLLAKGVSILSRQEGVVEYSEITFKQVVKRKSKLMPGRATGPHELFNYRVKVLICHLRDGN